MNIFQQIHTKYDKQLQEISKIVINQSKGKSQLSNNIIKNLISFGGKRIRPLLSIISFNICCNSSSQSNQDYLKIAAAIELLHNATLLHDDVIDDSKMRRGNKTANYQWGNKASILSGDLLLATSFQLIIAVGQMQILKSIADASKIMSDGEISQLSNIGNINISKEEYFDIIYAKTAILFSVATESGAILANIDSQKVILLKEFGKNLGMAFQIMDDVLDYDSDQVKMGKNIADDFFEGKVTLPIILLQDYCNLEEKDQIKNIFSNNEIKPNSEDFKLVNAILYKYDIIDKSKDLAKSYINKASDNISSFADCADKNIMLSIMEYVLNQK